MNQIEENSSKIQELYTTFISNNEVFFDGFYSEYSALMDENYKLLLENFKFLLAPKAKL